MARVPSSGRRHQTRPPIAVRRATWSRLLVPDVAPRPAIVGPLVAVADPGRKARHARAVAAGYRRPELRLAGRRPADHRPDILCPPCAPTLHRKAERDGTARD